MANESISSKGPTVQPAFGEIRAELADDLSRIVDVVTSAPNEAELRRVLTWLEAVALRFRMQLAPDAPAPDRVDTYLARAKARLDRLRGAIGT